MFPYKRLIQLGFGLVFIGLLVVLNVPGSPKILAVDSFRGDLSHDSKLTVVSRNDDGLKMLQSKLSKFKIALKRQRAILVNQQQELNRLVTLLENSDNFSGSDAIDDAGDSIFVESEEDYKVRRVTELDTAFASEVLDLGWNNEAIDEISQVLEQTAFAQTSLMNIACQATFCRMTLGHESYGDLEELVEQFVFDLGWETHSYVQSALNEDGSASTEVYFSRDGYRLPNA